MGPYRANDDGTITYVGNKLFKPIDNIIGSTFDIKEAESRVINLNNDKMWSKIARINHTINKSTNEYFNKINATFTLLPLTTRMISSPGALYGKEAINYTSDTCPITLNWFELKQKVFLSESSQIYLEIALMQDNIDQVYAIYNSFRKETADETHLSEFHHIEYEGKVNQNTNETIALGLIQKIIKDLLKNNLDDITYFLDDKDIQELEQLSNIIQNIPKITFKEALDVLYAATSDKKYLKFTMKHFGLWEEIKLTELFGNSMILIKQYPLLEVPFYHATVNGSNPAVADNADLIWLGYREILGSGHRVRNIRELEEKSKIFNLPLDDYAPYLQTRKLTSYVETSGFGLGWERFLQGLLKMPFIWSASAFPRVDNTIKP